MRNGRRRAGLRFAVLVVAAGQPGGQPTDRHLEAGMQVGEDRQVGGQLAQRHLFPAAAVFELLDPPVREVHPIDAGISAFSAAPSDRQPLRQAAGALRRHIYLEEEFLFPLLREAEPGLAAPVFVMLREHAQIWGTLDALALEPEPALCKQLAVQLLHHNSKEEKILYPRADEALPAAEAKRLRAFLDSGTLPEGWVCVKARRAGR